MLNVSLESVTDFAVFFFSALFFHSFHSELQQYHSSPAKRIIFFSLFLSSPDCFFFHSVSTRKMCSVCVCIEKESKNEKKHQKMSRFEREMNPQSCTCVLFFGIIVVIGESYVSFFFSFVFVVIFYLIAVCCCCFFRSTVVAFSVKMKKKNNNQQSLQGKILCIWHIRSTHRNSFTFLFHISLNFVQLVSLSFSRSLRKHNAIAYFGLSFSWLAHWNDRVFVELFIFIFRFVIHCSCTIRMTLLASLFLLLYAN